MNSEYEETESCCVLRARKEFAGRDKTLRKIKF